MNDRTAALMLASFYGSSKASTNKSMPFTAATAAGMFLHLFSVPKSALVAIRTMPPDPIWTLAAGYLETVVAESESDAMPPSAVGGG